QGLASVLVVCCSVTALPWGGVILPVCGRRSQGLHVQHGHARAWQSWRGPALPLEARRPQTPANRNGLLVDWSFTARLCAADRDAVEGFPWPGRPRGWAQLGGRSPGLHLAAAVLPAGRRRKVRGARSCVKARAARSPALLGPRLDTRSLRVGFAA